MFCCSALSHYQTTLSLCPLCEEAFQSPQTFRVTTVRTFGVDYSKSNAINIQHTHIHTHPQLRSQVYRCVRAWVCVSCRVPCSVCNVCLDFSHVVLIFGGFVLLFAFLECFCLLSKVNCSKHTQTHAYHLGTYILYVHMFCRLVFRCFF